MKKINGGSEQSWEGNEMEDHHKGEEKGIPSVMKVMRVRKGLENSIKSAKEQVGEQGC